MLVESLRPSSNKFSLSSSLGQTSDRRSKSLPEAQPNFFIKIIPDKTNSTLTIEDSGIGMTKTRGFCENGNERLDAKRTS